MVSKGEMWVFIYILKKNHKNTTLAMLQLRQTCAHIRWLYLKRKEQCGTSKSGRSSH